MSGPRCARTDRFTIAAVVTATLLVLGSLGGVGCSKKAAAPAGMGVAAPNAADCHDTSRAVACPPDSSDPSGRKLPAPGAVCTLPPCKPCGSATTPAFRDATGAAQPGWCICVPKSDDSGIGIYSCFKPADWSPPGG